MTLNDQWARERAVNDLDANFVVEAGAGAGKTTVLVSRLLNLILVAGKPIESIVAITFTRKAAGELKDRLRERLVEAAGDGEMRVRALAALEGLDSAPIGTIDSFTQRLLSKYPLEAGLPPGFRVMDPVEEAMEFDRWWADYFPQLAQEPRADAFAALQEMGYDARRMAEATRAMAKQLHAHWWRLGNSDEAFFSVVNALDDQGERLSRLLAELKPLRRPDCVESDKLAALIESLQGALFEALSNPSDGAIDALGRAAFPGRAGKGAVWGGSEGAEIARQRYKEVATSCRSSYWRFGVARRLGLLVADVSHGVVRHVQERHKQGLVTFGDALALACRLLRNQSVREKVREAYCTTLVDEFQDTSPLQVEFLTLLGTEPGRLFLVGDPKQSIYRFRGADVACFQAAKEVVGETLTLTSNFRSAPPVVGWVNDVFGVLFDPGHGQAAPTALDAVREWDDSAQATCFGMAHWGSNAEPDMAARLAAKAVREGWMVWDKEHGGMRRPARFSDIAILFPTRTSLPDLEAALAAHGAPWRVDCQTRLYDTQEAKDLLNALQAIDDPTDQVAVVGALRSAAFGCSDQDLLDWRVAGGGWTLCESAPEGQAGSAVGRAMATLRRLRDGRLDGTVAQAVSRAIAELRSAESCAALERPREGWQRLRILMEKARAFDATVGGTLREFVWWVRLQGEEGAREEETIAPESDEEAVRLMTVHAAKGLEFPIVIVVGFGRHPRSGGSSMIFPEGKPMEFRIGGKRDGVCSPGMREALELEEWADQMEHERLFYVATTRARDHLLVSLFHQVVANSEKGPTIAERLIDPLRLKSALVDDEDGPGLCARAAQTPRPPSREEWAAKRRHLVAERGTQPRQTATGLAALLAEPDDYDPDARDETWEPGVGGRRAGTAVGRAVHSVLQTVDLASGEGLRQLAEAQARAEGVPAADVARLASAALKAPSVQEAARTERVWREVFVGAPTEAGPIEGFIDLLYESPEGLVIVDYKTDVVRDEAEAQRKVRERYATQGAAYALGLRRALGRDAVAVRFLFLGGSRPYEVEAPELSTRVADLERALRTCS